MVTSALAIHNIADADGRRAAVDEAFRVVRADGRLLLVDFRHVADIAARLSELGARDVRVTGLGAQYWYGGPWAAASAVTAGKPAQ